MDKIEYIPRDLVSVYVGVKKYIVEVIGTENENEVLSYQIKFPNGEIQYAVMQVASVYACSAIFDEKTKVIEGRQKELEKAIINLHDALKEMEE